MFTFPIVKTVVWAAVATAALSLYNFIGPIINWWPFGSQPIFPSITWQTLYIGTFFVSFIVVWIFIRDAYNDGYQAGKKSASRIASK